MEPESRPHERFPSGIKWKWGKGVRSDAVTIEAATPEHLRLLLDDVPGFERAYDPSTGVLTGLGFTRTAELDSEDGPIWRWELPLPGSTNRGGGA